MVRTILATDGHGNAIYERRYVVPQNVNEDRYNLLVMRPAKFGAAIGAMGGSGLSLIVPVVSSTSVSFISTACFALIGGFAVGLHLWTESVKIYAEITHNIEEIPVTIEVDDTPRDTQPHISDVRGDLSIQHVYSANRALKTVTGDSMPISGEIIDSFISRVSGNDANTAINREICTNMPAFYPNESPTERKRAYGTFLDTLKHNNYVVQKGNTYHWNENGLRWLLED